MSTSTYRSRVARLATAKEKLAQLHRSQRSSTATMVSGDAGDDDDPGGGERVPISPSHDKYGLSPSSSLTPAVRPVDVETATTAKLPLQKPSSPRTSSILSDPTTPSPHPNTETQIHQLAHGFRLEQAAMKANLARAESESHALRTEKAEADERLRQSYIACEAMKLERDSFATREEKIREWMLRAASALGGESSAGSIDCFLSTDDLFHTLTDLFEAQTSSIRTNADRALLHAEARQDEPSLEAQYKTMLLDRDECIAFLETRTADLDGETTTLRAQLSELRARCETARGAEEELERARGETAALSREVSELRETVHRMETQQQTSNDRCSSLEGALEAARKEADAAKQELECVNANYDSLSAEHEKFREVGANLVDELRGLYKQMDTNEGYCSSTKKSCLPETASGKAWKLKLKSSKPSWNLRGRKLVKSQFALNKTLKAARLEVEEKLERARNETSALRSEVSELRETVLRLDTLQQNASDQFSSAKLELEIARKEADTANDELALLTVKYDSLSAEHEKFRGAGASLVEELQRLHDQLDDNETYLTDYEDKLHAGDSLRKTMELQIGRLQEELESSERDLKMARLEVEIDILDGWQSSKEELAMSQSEAKEWETQCQQLADQLSESKLLVEEKLEIIEVLQGELAKRQLDTSSSVDELEKIHAETVALWEQGRQEIGLLQSELSDAKTKMKASQNALQEKSQELEALRDEMEASRQEAASWRLEAGQAKDALADMAASLQRQEEEVFLLRSTLDDTEAKQRKLESQFEGTKVQLQEKENALELLEQELYSARREITSAECELSRLKEAEAETLSRYKTCKENLACIKVELLESETMQTSLKNEAAALESIIREKSEVISVLEQDLERAQSESMAYLAEASRLKEAEAAASEGWTSYSDEVAQMRFQLQESESNRHHIESELMDLRGLLREKSDMVDGAREELARAQCEVESMKVEVTRLNGVVAALHASEATVAMKSDLEAAQGLLQSQSEALEHGQLEASNCKLELTRLQEAQSPLPDGCEKCQAEQELQQGVQTLPEPSLSTREAALAETERRFLDQEAKLARELWKIERRLREREVSWADELNSKESEVERVRRELEARDDERRAMIAETEGLRLRLARAEEGRALLEKQYLYEVRFRRTTLCVETHT
ncbi:hypothetical protein DFJ73DRAFT_910716 [Zopfochytrium polystomum]|nr:hypothetical protein DFJ73DRAFT_910716 [Zopfochytrium polystomum]